MSFSRWLNRLAGHKTPAMHSSFVANRSPVARQTPHAATRNIHSNRSTAPFVFLIDSRARLTDAIKNMQPGDTLVITKSGDYGQIRFTNKHNIRLKSSSLRIIITANIFIDGNSSDIRIEGMNINYKGNKPYVIFTGPSCPDITIWHNIISSEASFPNEIHDSFLGDPKAWTSGIRILGKNCTIFNNQVINTKIGIVAQGIGTFVTGNVIRFFSEDAIRVQNHRILVDSNQIEDAVLANPNHPGHQDAIQLIPPADRFNAGELRDAKIIGNRIKSRSSKGRVPDSFAATLQGIFGSDGYFINAKIKDNTITTNSDHGITLNGVKNLILKRNRIFKAENTKTGFNPGIKLYFTRIGGGSSTWEDDLDYSVQYSNNQADVLNMPSEVYESTDEGGNQFAKVTQLSTRGRA